MNSAETRAFQSDKIAKKQSIDFKFYKRIQSSLKEYIQQKHLYFHPFVYIDDGSYDAEQFLYICRFNKCLFDRLFENVFVCPRHLCVHHCKPNSNTCVLIQEKRGSVFCQFSGTELSRHRAIGKTNKHCCYI